MKAIDAENRRLARVKPDDIPEPAMGFCVVRIVPPDETSGGIVIPEEVEGERTVAFVERTTAYMVKTSGNVIINGVLIPHLAKPGDRIAALPGAPPASGPPHLPEKHFVYRLDHVCAHWPKPDHESDPVLS